MIQLLLHNLSVQSCDLVCDYIIFVGKAEQSFMKLLLHDQSVWTLLIVGYVMKLTREAETILDAVAVSKSICSKLWSCLWLYNICWWGRAILDVVTASLSICSKIAYCWVCYETNWQCRNNPCCCYCFMIYMLLLSNFMFKYPFILLCFLIISEVG